VTIDSLIAMTISHNTQTVLLGRIGMHCMFLRKVNSKMTSEVSVINNC